MIDIEARTAARQIVQKILVDGLHPNDVEFNWPTTNDLAVRSIKFWLWTLYDDDSNASVRFPERSEEQSTLRNVEEFLGTSAPFEPMKRGIIAKAKHLLAAGVEWHECELPWHERWPFPPRESDRTIGGV